jgi:copper resistance protein B
MDMDDASSRGRVLLEQLDWRDTGSGTALAWNAQAWYGTDYNKLWLKTEGERLAGTTPDARAEVLWDHVFSRWWSAQTGVRRDFGSGPERNWLALGVAGLAPYFFAVEATAYLGDVGRTAARLRTQCELLLAQRWILQPELELNAYGRDDPQRYIGSGVSDLQLALRLRYEIHREFAPYVGIVWVQRFGKTAELARAAGADGDSLQALIGIRAWF